MMLGKMVAFCVFAARHVLCAKDHHAHTQTRSTAHNTTMYMSQRATGAQGCRCCVETGWQNEMLQIAALGVSAENGGPKMQISSQTNNLPPGHNIG